MLHFFETIKATHINILLLDEPDVHLHPDLQASLARFLVACLEEVPSELKHVVLICMATRSMPLVSQCATYSGCSIGVKSFESNDVTLSPASKEFQKLAPFFGHPLSLVIGNETPLIVEGEDDERIWQQAGRSAAGRLKIFPLRCAHRERTDRSRTGS